MKRSVPTGTLTSLALGLAAILALSGCKEKDVPVISDEEHITDYLAHVTIAKELFRTDGLFNPTPYTVPFDSAVITDRVLSRSRTMTVDVSNGKVDHGYLGKVKDAYVYVTDLFTLEVTRAHRIDTLIDTLSVELGRRAFFMQLGDLDRVDAGWVLWSVDCVPSQTVTATSTPGGNVRIGSDFVKLTDIDTVPAGSRLRVTASWTGDSLSAYHLLSDYDQTGAFTRPMLHYPGGVNYDSLSYVTPTNNPRYYNEFMIQTFSPVNFPRRAAFVVPYHN